MPTLAKGKTPCNVRTHVQLILPKSCRDEEQERRASSGGLCVLLALFAPVAHCIIQVDELNAKDRYGHLATIKSNEKRIAQTKELIANQEKVVEEEGEVAYFAEREKGLADALLAREEAEEAELLKAEERMRQEEGHLSE